MRGATHQDKFRDWQVSGLLTVAQYSKKFLIFKRTWCQVCKHILKQFCLSQQCNLMSSNCQVKILPNLDWMGHIFRPLFNPKIGLQSDFGLRIWVQFEAWPRKKFRQACCTSSIIWFHLYGLEVKKVLRNSDIWLLFLAFSLRLRVGPVNEEDEQNIVQFEEPTPSTSQAWRTLLNTKWVRLQPEFSGEKLKSPVNALCQRLESYFSAPDAQETVL